MDYDVSAFLSLLNKSVHNSFAKLLPPINWIAVFTLAKNHNVLPLIFEAASGYADFANSPNYQTYMAISMQWIMRQAQHTEEFLNLYRAFLAEDLHPIVMKGLVCRQLYGELADHRPSGDEDILVEKKDFEKAKSILEKQGYKIEREDITEGQIDELQEISFYGPGEDGLYIELHLNPTGHGNPLCSRMNERFKDVFTNYREFDVDGVTVRTMNHTDHFLYLVFHAFRHLISGGFGIRQVLDILLYAEKYGNEIDWNYIKFTTKDFEAELFLSDLIHIGNTYLGFKLKPLCPPNCPDELLDDLMSNGAFGNGTEAQRSAHELTRAAFSSRGKAKHSNSAKALLNAIFPDKAQMLNQHPELEDMPWLLPKVWVGRWIKFIRLSKGANKNLALEGMKISRRRTELLKKYKIL